MQQAITLIPGDGIGPEVTRAVVRVLEASGFTPEWESFSAGAGAVEEHGTTLPQPLLDSITRNKIALKGPIGTPVGKGFTSVNVGLRKALDLYANLRPVSNLPSVASRYQDVDLVIVRENTEDLYAGLEHTVVPASSRASRSSPTRRRRGSPSSRSTRRDGAAARKSRRCTRPTS
jgi:isocitrate dehydrogenase (NAD+)